MMNKEGSQPFKMTFVKFLLQELDKKARQEDRIVATKGVHVKTPDNATIPGLAIHRGDGIFIKLWRAVNIDKKVTFSLIGNPTSANIVDYVKNLIDKNIPEEEKNNEGLPQAPVRRVVHQYRVVGRRRPPSLHSGKK